MRGFLANFILELDNQLLELRINSRIDDTNVSNRLNYCKYIYSTEWNDPNRLLLKNQKALKVKRTVCTINDEFYCRML